MKPAYMPFTYASASMIECIYQSVGPVVMLEPVSGSAAEPMRQAAEAGRIDLRTPVSGDDEKIKASVEKFKLWGAAHEGHMDAFKTMAENYDSEAFTAELRSDILRGEARADSADPIFNARLFLALAQEYDMQQTELQTELQAAEASRRQMLAALKGESEAGDVSSASGLPGDPGHYLTEHRICSWLRLLTAAPEAGRVWLTSSPAVFDYMLEFIPGAQVLAHLSRLPATDALKSDLNTYLSGLADGRSAEPPAAAPEEITEGRQPHSMTVAVLPFASAGDVLDRLLSETADGTHPGGHAAETQTPSGSGPSGQIVMACLDDRR